MLNVQVGDVRSVQRRARPARSRTARGAGATVPSSPPGTAWPPRAAPAPRRARRSAGTTPRRRPGRRSGCPAPIANDSLRSGGCSRPSGCPRPPRSASTPGGSHPRPPTRTAYALLHRRRQREEPPRGRPQLGTQRRAHAVPGDQQEPGVLQPGVDGGPGRVAVAPGVEIHGRDHRRTSPMSSYHRSGWAAMKSVIRRDAPLVVEHGDVDAVLGEPVVPAVERRAPRRRRPRPMPNWRTSPEQYQHGESVVTMVVLAVVALPPGRPEGGGLARASTGRRPGRGGCGRGRAACRRAANRAAPIGIPPSASPARASSTATASSLGSVRQTGRQCCPPRRRKSTA